MDDRDVDAGAIRWPETNRREKYHMPNGLSADQDDMVDADIRRFVDAIGAAYAAHGAPADAGLAERRLVAERVRQPWREGGPIMAESGAATAFSSAI